MSEEKMLKLEQKEHVAYVTLNRPEKRNTMTLSFFREMLDLFKQLDKDDSVRVVVIKGAGKSFTGGLDLGDAASMFSGDGGAASREKIRLDISELQEGMNWVEKCRKPVIAAVHGFCIGGGIDLLAASDIRIAAKDAVFSIRETRVAIIADVGTLQRLPHIIGHGWTRELALTGRDFTAEEALSMGLITRVCESKEALFEEADRLADQIAGLSPLAVQGTKDVINYSRDNGIYPGLDYVAQKNASALISEDVVEAAAAFMEKRAPVFKGN
jgi:enoyl-CoA hydratase/carnithine racemase